MLWQPRTSLAWSLLAHDKKRLFLSVVGVAFAVFLMFIEMGFLNGVYDSQTLLIRRLNADLVMLNRLKDALTPTKPFSRRRLVEALRFPGVQAVYPLYMSEGGAWKNGHGRIDWITAVAFDPRDPVLLFPELNAFRDALQQPDTAIADLRSRSFFGPLRPGTVSELNGRRIRLVGQFSLGPDFRVDGRLIMSDRNFVRYFPDLRTGRPDFDRIELGLIKAVPGTDLEQLRRRLQEMLPDDVRVLTRDGLEREERRFWAANQPVGIVFGLGMLVGFVIGVTICYQILFTDVHDHQAEFATLKAIGYADSALVGTVLREGLYLSLAAFLPGLGISLLLYSSLEHMTGITMQLTWLRLAVVLVLTVVMCLVSAALAIRKVLRSDPAEVFG
jgi:putative ABC transport system permease protein